MDTILDFFRPGDNVVFQVSDLNDYLFFVKRFVKEAKHDKKNLIYIRFAMHPELVPEKDARKYTLDPGAGFENFTVSLYRIIESEGRNAFYVFDCLSELQVNWAADLMMGNFFCVICPYLFSLDTVAFFPIIRGNHSYKTVARIRETTQIFLDVYSFGRNSSDNRIYLHPVKAQGRYSPKMFMPHSVDRKTGEFKPLYDAAGVNHYYAVVRKEEAHENLNLDSWERFFLKSKKAPQKENKIICDSFCRMLIGEDKKLCRLFEKYFTREDYFQIRDRMIGTGRIGGKSCGILLSRKMISVKLPDLYSRLESHDSFYIGNHVFYTFLVVNDLWKLRILQRKNGEFDYKAASELAGKIMEGTFPDSIRQKFARVLEYYGQVPLVIRSSSLLEDSFGNAFAGKYESVFCINGGTPENRLQDFENAVKKVYASTMNPDALRYREKRGLKDRDEQMSVLVQRVSGSVVSMMSEKGERTELFYPSASGVGYSEDPWNWDRSIDVRRGMLRMVAGLATRAVQRTGTDYPRIIHIDRPSKTTLVTQNEKVNFSQHYVDVLNLKKNCLESIPIKKIMEQSESYYVGAVSDRDTEVEEKLYKLGKQEKMYYGTCRGFAENKEFLHDMEMILKTLEKEYGYPVDIEFTVNLFPAEKEGEITFLICILQCRPLSFLNSPRMLKLPDKKHTEILFSAAGVSMGVSQCRKIEIVVYIDSRMYKDLPYRNKAEVGKEIMDLNESFGGDGKSLMLISPGRVGTSSPELGVPLRFADLSNFSAIIEYDDAENGFQPELSFGSHLFQDFVESGIFYTALFSGGMKPAVLKKETLFGGNIPQRVVSVYDVSVRGLTLWYDMVSGKVLCGYPIK